MWQRFFYEMKFKIMQGVQNTMQVFIKKTEANNLILLAFPYIWLHLLPLFFFFLGPGFYHGVTQDLGKMQ